MPLLQSSRQHHGQCRAGHYAELTRLRHRPGQPPAGNSDAHAALDDHRSVHEVDLSGALSGASVGTATWRAEPADLDNTSVPRLRILIRRVLSPRDRPGAKEVRCESEAADLVGRTGAPDRKSNSRPTTKTTVPAGYSGCRSYVFAIFQPYSFAFRST